MAKLAQLALQIVQHVQVLLNAKLVKVGLVYKALHARRALLPLT